MLSLSELGLRLKSAREEKKITLDELQEITKIQKRYLQSIEEGKLDTLPGQFYARAFVKSYAEAVGLDPDVLFDEHANELPASNKQVTEIPPRVRSRKAQATQKTRQILSFLPSFVAIVFIISILIGIWYFLQNDTVREDEVPPDNTVQSPVEGGRNEEALDPQGEEDEAEADEEEIEELVEEVIEETPKQQLVLLETKGNETIYNLVAATEFAFEIELHGKSYIGIDNRKGKTFHAANVDGGNTLPFDFSEEETIQFNFGASNNVNLYINGELFVFPLDIVHQKVTFHFLKNEAE